MKVNEVKYNSPTVDWMPEIPNHWKVVRIKNLFYEVDERSKTGREDLLSVSHYTGVTLRKEGFDDDVEITNARTLVGYKIVDVGDLVINIMLAWNGSLGVSRFKGITSPAYCVFRLKENYNPEYFGYLFSTALFKGEFKKSSTGIIDSRLRLYSDDFFRIFSFVPPKDEQDKIVNYIKEISVKIQHFIETKQRFIELLKEQKQNIITNAVTKGIDKNVKLKSSGVAWLGDVPDHWKVIRLKFIGESFIGLTYSPTEVVGSDEGTLVLRSSNIQNGRLSLADNVYVTKSISKKLITKKGDILLCSRNGSADLIGKNIIINEQTEGVTFGAFMTIFRSKMNDYLYYFFNSNIFLSQTALFGTSTINQLTNEILKNMMIAFPQSLNEQNNIIDYIKTETQPLDIAIDKAEREIELMEEYREAIIYEAVTGKIKL